MLWHCLNSGSDFFHTVSEAKNYPQMKSAIAILFEIFLHFTQINWYFERLLNRYKYYIRQHRTMGAAGFRGSFNPIVQYEKWEIHPVFPHFPYFRLGQNLSLNLLIPLCGVAIIFHCLLDGEQFSFASGRFCVFCTNIWTFKWERVIVKSHSFEIGGLRYERNDFQGSGPGNGTAGTC